VKLTVSSTSMMKPIFSIDASKHAVSPPQRVLGLLKSTTPAIENNPISEKLVQYQRPHQQHALLKTAQWLDFLQLDDKRADSCAAVFGFEFDGEHIWYQIWNHTTERACWLRHTDNMEYNPFAILAMDALVTLLPNWDGALYQSPASVNTPTPVRKEEADIIDANKVHNVLVSDSSTCKAGKLWFLVTLNTTDTQMGKESKPIPPLCGWISQSANVCTAA